MEELDLKELFNIFWNRKVYIILITVIFIFVGIVYTTVMVKPKYKSETSLILAKIETTQESGKDSITQTDITLNQKLLPTYSELIKKNIVLRPVIENLGLDITEDALGRAISIQLANDSEIIEIIVVNENPEYATAIANEVAKVFTEKVSEIYSINNVSIVDKAEVPNSPYNINHTKDVAICYT